MNTELIAGLVSEPKKAKPKTEGISVPASGDIAIIIEKLAERLRKDVRKVTGRSMARTDAREIINSLFYVAFFTKSDVITYQIDDDNKWQAHVGTFESAEALASVLLKADEGKPDNQDDNKAEPKGDSENQEKLVLEGDEASAGTRNAESQTVNDDTDSSSNEEMSAMARARLKHITGGA
ncbi:hypothetical protein C6380_17640 [Pseudomonas syringae pv. actinidiae]|uniref:hypothetical protein n=1 Tax=Pseudomonas syringae TaxID=317 RepID=UPI000BB57C99|nr:hypothetical protein [Pseudomonas syringae]PBK53829.1 hypothetical protein BUE60_11345 [Pseudomonas syringae pv. actinidiae]PBK55537.1 hypothetical protein BUE61_07335 [Pseudomonas syringae pv. actinidiae]RJX53991.1 hypothetical protein C6380_17640 [Pseudomonas syringae pv. actinidiae]RJX63533.1 hypothetical protein C6379_00305 [Pseudomonas syringae pv. actinidiae]RJX65178.1 hypothetical protein C6383_00020 [Pseudomonas syringae pv. actinidiae]